MGHSIERIESINGSTSDSKHINEFLSNVDKEIFNIIQKHLDQLKESNSIKPMIIQTTDAMREHGVTTDTVEIPITFDPSTFFV
jgi:hypothetical protein